MDDTSRDPFILADGRWSGQHGIGRFSTEVLSRLHHADILTDGPKPLSMQNWVWQTRQLFRAKKKYRIFFSPGFNPVPCSPIPFVITLHDLIHLFAPGNAKLHQKMYYHFLMKPTVTRARYILTVSEYSKKNILEWTDIAEDKIINVSGGISGHLKAEGLKHTPGYPYLLHVGNAKKIHKNVLRLLQAFSKAKIDPELRLILTGEFSPELNKWVHTHHLENRIIVQKNLPEETLAEYYRGALAVVFPSLYEGFGLPVVEGMASGVPVLTSNITSLPEIAGDAALLVDPYEVDAIREGLEKIVSDTALRAELIERGLARARLFSWEKTAQMVQKVLNCSI